MNKEKWNKELNDEIYKTTLDIVKLSAEMYPDFDKEANDDFKKKADELKELLKNYAVKFYQLNRDLFLIAEKEKRFDKAENGDLNE